MVIIHVRVHGDQHTVAGENYNRYILWNYIHTEYFIFLPQDILHVPAALSKMKTFDSNIRHPRRFVMFI